MEVTQLPIATNIKISHSEDRVYDWLSDIVAFTDIIPQPPTIHSPKRKIAMSENETTPRPKRARPTDLITPFASIGGPLRIQPPSRTSTSRSSSPTKRQGQIEAEFSKPAHIFHTRADTKRWKAQNQRDIPLFIGLEAAIHNSSPQPLPDVHAEAFNQILAGIEYCQAREGTEDMWNDMVINPALQLARQMSCRKMIDVINVKSIDVKPSRLLPRQPLTTLSIPSKRIDYTIGLKITEDDDRMWRILRDVQDHTIAQNPHPMVRDRALFAHIEIKTGDTASGREAKLQQFVWCAAGFAKQEELWLARDQRRRASMEPNSQSNVEQLAPVLLLRWTKDAVEVSVAVMDSAKERIDVLDEKKLALDGADEENLRKILQMLVRVMNWGSVEYLPWFKSLFGDEDWT